MKHSKILPLMFGGALAVCWGATGCALSTPSGGEETASEQQAWTTIPGDMAFASSTNTTGSAPADSAFSLSSGGGTINVSNIGTGQYRVDIPNLGSTIGGHVQVMARGLDLTRCKVGGWGSAGSTLQVFVNCFSSRGTPANSIFAMNYVRRDDHPGPEAAYVYA